MLVASPWAVASLPLRPDVASVDPLTEALDGPPLPEAEALRDESAPLAELVAKPSAVALEPPWAEASKLALAELSSPETAVLADPPLSAEALPPLPLAVERTPLSATWLPCVTEPDASPPVEVLPPVAEELKSPVAAAPDVPTEALVAPLPETAAVLPLASAVEPAAMLAEPLLPPPTVLPAPPVSEALAGPPDALAWPPKLELAVVPALVEPRLALVFAAALAAVLPIADALVSATAPLVMLPTPE